jgi:hypothetical protein
MMPMLLDALLTTNLTLRVVVVAVVIEIVIYSCELHGLSRGSLLIPIFNL